MVKTLLEIVQDILNDMDSDEVNSIDDTVESQQVASIVRQCYQEMMASRNWPHLRQFITLNSSLSTASPTQFIVPSNMKEMVFVKYDCQRPTDNGKVSYQEIKYLYPDEFLEFVSARNNLDSNVQTVVQTGGIKLFIFNDQPPRYWTSFDDYNIYMDSYEKALESTLQSSKTQCLAYLEPTWSHVGSAVPNLPSEAFAALTEEAKSTAFMALKQIPNQKAEAKAQRQQRWLARKAFRTHGGVRYDNYGRRSSKG